MIANISTYNQKRIETFDYILEKLNSSSSGYAILYDTEEYSTNYLEESASILYGLGFTYRYASSSGSLSMRITPKGKSFIEGSSFKKQKEIELERIERERIQHMVNEKTLKAAKREPWLIAWGVVSTIISILLAIFK